MRSFARGLSVGLIVLMAGSAGAPAALAAETATSEGTSIAKAVVIKAPNELAGMDAERAWIKQHLPGYGLGEQRLVSDHDHMYDVFKVHTAAGETRDVYFDITDYFGKM